MNAPVSYSKRNESQRSSSTSASGIFRGFLGNVGSHVLGTTDGPSVDELHDQIYKLEQENQVLREELEAKINENERLVMDTCDLRRECRDVQLQFSSLSELHSRCEQEAGCRDQVIARITDESTSIRTSFERKEIECDKTRRELELLSDSHSKLRMEANELRVRLDSIAAINAGLESQVSELSGKALQHAAMISHLQKELECSSQENAVLQTKLETETVLKKSLQLRLDQKQDEMKLLAALQSSSDQSTPRLVVPDPPPSHCGRSCCERSQFYRDQCLNLEHSLRILKAKVLSG